MNSDPGPWSLQIQGVALKFQAKGQAEFLQDKNDHLLTFIHKTQVVCPCAVPFEQSELGKMALTSFPFPEALTDLKDLGIPGRKEPLHAQFRRRVQKNPASADRIDMKLGSRRRDEAGGLDFEIVFFSEKMPDRLDQSGPQPEGRPFGG
jgi:hypothetical protein